MAVVFLNDEQFWFRSSACFCPPGRGFTREAKQETTIPCAKACRTAGVVRVDTPFDPQNKRSFVLQYGPAKCTRAHWNMDPEESVLERTCSRRQCFSVGRCQTFVFSPPRVPTWNVWCVLAGWSHVRPVRGQPCVQIDIGHRLRSQNIPLSAVCTRLA